MFTLCPKCALTLVVTAADLRVAQGYVRCGRCLNVFNALSRLSEERPTPPPESPPESPPEAPPESLAEPVPDTTADGLPYQTQAAADEVPPPTEEEPEPSSTIDDTGEIEIELDPSIFVTSVRPPVASERMTQTEAQAEEPSPAPVPAPAAKSVAPAPVPAAPTPAPPTPVAQSPIAAASVTAAPVTTTPVTAATTASVTAAPATSAPATTPPPAEEQDAKRTNTPEESSDGAFDLRTQRSRVDLAWRIGAGALVIALMLQIVNHYRDTLAANSALRGPLTAVYAALGVKLAPHWDIHAYDVRQLGASVAGAAAGEIVVRASVKNSASRAQPLPLLRVTLQDRFGNRIAARDVPPGDYLPSSVTPSSLLAGGSRVDATMVFVDPGPQAVGFEIDACLRQQSGEVACAHGQ